MLPCALHLPEFNTLVACGCKAHMSEKLTSRYFDVGRYFDPNAALIGEIVGYTMNQSSTYMQKSLELISIADLLLREYMKNGAELMKYDKLKNYARRKILSMISERKSGGTETERSISAITCGGYRFSELPVDYRIIRLDDELIAASQLFVKKASLAANKLGYDTIISRSVDTENSPFHLLIPKLKTAFVSESSVLKTKFRDSEKISFDRFYSRSLIPSREHYISFFGSYIRKIYSEAILYAKICMDIKNQGRKLLMPYISEKTTSEIASEIVHGILNT